MANKVLIVLATHNRAHLIRETLDSILKQTMSDWECIIVDDYSSDNTSELVQEYISSDSRFSYFLKTNNYNKGLSGTRNYGLDIARTRKADFIQFFDDDDIMHPRKLELQTIPMIRDPELNFTFCKYEKLIQNQRGSKVVKPDLKVDFPHLGDAILTGELRLNSLGPLWRKNFIDQFRFDETLKYAEEWELYVRIGYQFPKNYGVVDEILFQYRKHAESLTLREDEDFERRKTSAIIRDKILLFLNSHRLHTEKSILFLSKSFLLDSYQPKYVKQLLEYLEQNSGFSQKVKVFLRVSLILVKTFRRLINGLAKLV